MNEKLTLKKLTEVVNEYIELDTSCSLEQECLSFKSFLPPKQMG